MQKHEKFGVAALLVAIGLMIAGSSDTKKTGPSQITITGGATFECSTTHSSWFSLNCYDVEGKKLFEVGAGILEKIEPIK